MDFKCFELEQLVNALKTHMSENAIWPRTKKPYAYISTPVFSVVFEDF